MFFSIYGFCYSMLQLPVCSKKQPNVGKYPSTMAGEQAASVVLIKMVHVPVWECKQLAHIPCMYCICIVCARISKSSKPTMLDLFCLLVYKPIVIATMNHRNHLVVNQLCYAYLVQVLEGPLPAERPRAGQDPGPRTKMHRMQSGVSWLAKLMLNQHYAGSR